MNDLLTTIISYFNLALLAIGAQNAIFTRALGISPGIKMLRDPRKNTFYFCSALTVFQVMTSVLVYFALPLV
ncbi:MAG: NADH:ubiquinone oxidoreductase, subunit RnfA, partial [Oscillospiraceae bacterium]|nr:NADH:ubiquinone oxidoreductase, subunit RnfA [Oscillospiraceae bacterium]